MTPEELYDLDEVNKWCEVFGLPPITSYEIKKRNEEIRNSWAFAYTSKGTEYYPKYPILSYGRLEF